MWSCKDCGTTVSTRVHLLKHYRLAHGKFGRRHPYPCSYSDCPCVFKTYSLQDFEVGIVNTSEAENLADGDIDNLSQSGECDEDNAVVNSLITIWSTETL